MARCEDFPCCGHDICPDYDETGKQVNMRCTCGAVVPLGSRSSLCAGCLMVPDPGDDSEDFRDFDNRDYEEPGDYEKEETGHAEDQDS